MRNPSVPVLTLLVCLLGGIPNGTLFAVGLGTSDRNGGPSPQAPLAAATDTPSIASPSLPTPPQHAVPAKNAVPVNDASFPDSSYSTNTRMVKCIVTSAQKHGLKIRQWGHGRVRFITVDEPPVDLTEALKAANQCMNRMEKITGNQDTYISKNPPAEQIFYLVLYNTEEEVITLCDEIRAQHLFVQSDGVALVPKYPTFPLPHGGVGSLEQIGFMLPEWAVAMTAGTMIDSFFTARQDGMQAPAWLREGLAADMQQQICDRILWITIAFQDKPQIKSNDWYADVRKIIASHGQSKKTAEEVMSMNLDGLTRASYQQMWSLETYICQMANEQIGPQNKLRKIMDLIADRISSTHAVGTVLGTDMWQLTAAWNQWALDQ